MRQANLKKLYAHGSDYQRYESFQECSSYATMTRHHPLNPQLMQWGMHILFKQAVDGSIIIGDSEVLP